MTSEQRRRASSNYGTSTTNRLNFKRISRFRLWTFGWESVHGLRGGRRWLVTKLGGVSVTYWEIIWPGRSGIRWMWWRLAGATPLVQSDEPHITVTYDLSKWSADNGIGYCERHGNSHKHKTLIQWLRNLYQKPYLEHLRKFLAIRKSVEV